jgi:hypothetical protein
MPYKDPEKNREYKKQYRQRSDYKQQKKKWDKTYQKKHEETIREEKESRTEDGLNEESWDIQNEILGKIEILILAKWDSDTVKSEI